MQNVQLVPSIEGVEKLAEQYKLLSRQIEELESVKREVSQYLLEEVKKTADKKIIAGIFKVSMVQRVSESFDLKTARTKMDPNLLSPFIKISTSEYVRVS